MTTTIRITNDAGKAIQILDNLYPENVRTLSPGETSSQIAVHSNTLSITEVELPVEETPAEDAETSPNDTTDSVTDTNAAETEDSTSVESLPSDSAESDEAKGEEEAA